jgi:putative sigma-54 modulation protein
MDYRIIGRGVDVSDAIKNYIDRRLEKIDRVLYDGDLTSMEVRIEKDAENYIVRIILNLKGDILKVEERNVDLYTAIDFASDALERQVKKLRDRMRMRHKAGSKGLTGVIAEEISSEIPSDLPEDNITSVKRIALVPMSVEEAVLQMETMDHMFLVFRNSETDEINVIYRKKEGEYGLLELYE